MTPDRYAPLFDRDFLRAALTYDFDAWKARGDDTAMIARLKDWSARKLTGETEAEAAFLQRFFVETWGYVPDGAGAAIFNLAPRFAIPGAGAGGGAGEADLAIGLFGEGRTAIAQVLCEFKGIRTGLDAPQPRKGNTRSPVRQALDYLAGAKRGLFGNEPIQPRFAIVTDMDEFRLYWFDRAPERYQRFKIGAGDLFNPGSLLATGDAGAFERFLFWRLFRADMLVSEAGRTGLERLLEKQGRAERRLEKAFYREYTAYRGVLYNQFLLQDLGGIGKGAKLRLAQKLLDRFVFIMFCEDMGGRVAFPPHLLKEVLIKESRERFYEPQLDDVWLRLKRLFLQMDQGGQFGIEPVHRFNGGLFAHDPVLDGLLTLPNHVFCKRGQGATEADIETAKDTLLYLSATYNFAAEGDAKNSIGVYTLGHIFEQSIVELEALEAEAEGRESLTELTKRKRDGVYYTPEWAVREIVAQTIDPLFAAWRAEAGWPAQGDPAPDAWTAYWARTGAMRVLDPACGSGAFLVGALRHLLEERERMADLGVRLGALAQRPEKHALTQAILSDNLYGVDINSASVEITKLSLWLHTAAARQPLSMLDHTIQCGNSLVDARFYEGRELYGEEARERINTFDWEDNFPEAFAAGGFDAVIGNPPYVKLQNFRRVHSDMAEWLMRGTDGAAPYQSTGTGNFDLYLPFIEKGLLLLNAGGRMGVIAPNLWPTLEYGEALRALVHAGGHLERWLDFRSFQVFEKVTVYTAIQIFTRAKNDIVRLAFAPDGEPAGADWADAAMAVPYAALPPRGEWRLAPEPVRALQARLAGPGFRRLDDPAVTRAIFQGLITSADHIYHLKRLARGRYMHQPAKSRGARTAPPPVEIALEDAIMKPLVSGAEAKRFLEPQTETYLLFPYEVNGAARLWTPDEMHARFPKAWAYLQSYETELRAREHKAFDDDGWYRFGRNQNIDKQEVAKLIVAQTVPSMRVCFDDGGRFYANNVRVNGILPGEDGWYLLGILNCPTIDYLFKWIGKPKDNGYYEANKQFIAPLPVPIADAQATARVGGLARALQAAHTARRATLAGLEERLARTARHKKPLEWLLPDVRPMQALAAFAPAGLKPSELRAWEDRQRAEDEDAAIALLDAAIRPGSDYAARVQRGALDFLVDAVPVARAFVGAEEGELLLAQWRLVALTFEANGGDNGRRLIERLRFVATHADPAVAAQILALAADVGTLSVEIARDEAALHEETCALFVLGPAERALVERGR